jgi:hypothetical protein
MEREDIKKRGLDVYAGIGFCQFRIFALGEIALV